MTATEPTLPRNPGKTNARQPPRTRHAGLREPLAWFLGAAGVYLVVAAVLSHDNVVFTDATSRVANAYYVLFSRDPHLPAMGFVWNPLPSFVLLPILPLKAIFPGLVVFGAAGAIQSALSMAAAIAGICVCLRKLGVPRTARSILVALVAVQPMVLLYAGSGQSEPLLILFLVLTTSALISWAHNGQCGHLVVAGVALGLGYLTRYEAGACAVAVTVFVAVVTRWRTRESADRLRYAINDTMLVAGPFLAAFAFWSVSSKVIVDEWMPTFGSRYGNSAQVSAAREWIEATTGTGVGQQLDYLGRQVAALAPLIAVLAAVALVLAIRRRELTAAVAPVVFGSVMAFCALVFILGSSFGWLRFQITAIPLTALLAGSIVAMLIRPVDRTTGSASAGRTRRPGWAVAGVLTAVGLAIPVQAFVLTTPSLQLAREEAPMLAGLLFPDRAGSDPNLLNTFVTERDISAYLDQLDPGRGSVLVDSAFAFPVIISSKRPETFVISSDFDFDAAVADPSGHDVKFLLVRSDSRSDAVQTAWPGLYDNGAGISTLARSWDGVQGTWRLYAIDRD